jgi:hypothetical protein
VRLNVSTSYLTANYDFISTLFGRRLLTRKAFAFTQAFAQVICGVYVRSTARHAIHL